MNGAHIQKGETMTHKNLAVGIVTCLFVGITTSAVAGSIRGTIHAKGLRNATDAVVYIEKIDNKAFPPPTEPVIMDQNARVFLPSILPVLVGTRVEFLNSDPFHHNVFTPDECADKFDVGSWEKGDKRSHVFDKPCVAVLLCNLHPEMAAHVVVVETPYFATTDDDGKFTIDNVPDGTYVISVWHERAKKVSQEITVSGPTRVGLTMVRGQ